MKIHTLVASVILGAQAQMKYPPPIPALFPPNNQQIFIPASFLSDPLITDAVKYAKSKVKPELWNLKPSKYIKYSTVEYPPEQLATSCYYPNGCVRNSDTPDFKADISTCPNANDWGLTFDDGPSVYKDIGTPTLLKALADAKIKATFFITGTAALGNPQIVTSIKDQGHEVAIHTWTHHPLTSCTSEQIVAELKYTEAIIYKATGVVTKSYRPPYGDIDDRVRAIATALGYRTIMWTISPDRDSHDTGASDPASIGVMSELIKKDWFPSQKGFISLNHDISQNTLKIAVQMVKDIAAAGNIGTKPQPVGTCQGVDPSNWYIYDKANPVDVILPVDGTPVTPPVTPPNTVPQVPAPKPDPRQSGSATLTNSGKMVSGNFVMLSNKMFFPTLLVSLSVITVCNSAKTINPPQNPPPMPHTWPADFKLITGDFLKDPLVDDAYAYVKSVVPEEILNIPQSLRRSPGLGLDKNGVIYRADPIQNCYFRVFNKKKCIRTINAEYWDADIYTCPLQNDWGLTFDDGPYKDPEGKFGTAQLLKKLEQKKVKATFFVVGCMVKKLPQTTKMITDLGNEISIHTWNHAPLTTLTNKQIVAEIKYTEAIIYKATGKVPNTIRPPFGDMDDRVRAIFKALGYKTILWTAPPNRSSNDFAAVGEKGKTSVIDLVYSWIKTEDQPGFISLSHDRSRTVVEIALRMLEGLSARFGVNLPIKMKSVGQCLGMGANAWYA